MEWSKIQRATFGYIPNFLGGNLDSPKYAKNLTKVWSEPVSKMFDKGIFELKNYCRFKIALSSWLSKEKNQHYINWSFVTLTPSEGKKPYIEELNFSLQKVERNFEQFSFL